MDRNAHVVRYQEVDIGNIFDEFLNDFPQNFRQIIVKISKNGTKRKNSEFS